ncbi:MAG: sialidase family protein [Verrucomicrobiota bacterium]
MTRKNLLFLFALVLVSAPGKDDAGPGYRRDVSRGYTLPIVDLDGQADRQLIIDREEGQYLGHPNTVMLEDQKTIFIAYPKGHGRGALILKQSLDAGRTWSARLPTPENWASSREVPTLHRVVDARGKKRIIMFSGLYPCRMAISEDDGASWSGIEPIGDWGGIVCMGDLIGLKKAGHYMAMFHDDGRFFKGKGSRNGVFKVFTVFSEDGGVTWGEPKEIISRGDVHLCEPGFIRSPDGKTIAVLFRENARRRNSFVIFSHDEAKTWTAPRELPGALTGDRHQLMYTPDGRILASFRDRTHESPTWGDWVGWVGAWEDIVEGREGQYRIRFKDNHKGADCAYPTLEKLSDGSFLNITYGHWQAGESPYILQVRFTIEELDAMAKKLRKQ